MAKVYILMLLMWLSSLFIGHAGGNHGGPTAALLPQWTEHLELFHAIEPKLKKEDKELFEMVSPLLASNPQGAIALIQKASREKRSPIFDFLLGNLLLSEDREAEGEAALHLCLKKFPNFKKAHRSLANLYAQRGEWAEAREHALVVISSGGVDGKLYGLLAYTHFEQEHFSSALSAYRMARMYQHDHLSYQKGELYCLVKLGLHEEVVTLSREILDRTSKQRDEQKKSIQHKELWLIQVNALLNMEKDLEALAILEWVDAQGLAQKSELSLLGRLYFNQSCISAAVDVFVRAMAAGASLNTFDVVLTSLVQQGLSTEAGRLLKAGEANYASSILANHEPWRMAEVQFLLQQGQSDRAEKQCRELLKRWPMNGSALMILAQHLLEKEKLDEARFYFERAALLENVQVQAWRALGRLAWLDKDAATAISWLEKVDEHRSSMAMKETIARLRDRL